MDRSGDTARTVDAGGLAARLALILALVAAVFVLFAPLGTSQTQTAVEPGQPAPLALEGRTTLLAEEGPVAVLLVGFPVLLAAIPVAGDRLWPRRRALRVVSAAALWVFVIAGLASIGLYFVPGAALMTFAAARRPAPASPEATR